MVTLAPKLKKSDGYIDFAQPAGKIVNLIRGMWSWPGAQCDYLSASNGKKTRVTLAKAAVVDNIPGSNISPGSFDENMNIVCGDAAIEIQEIKPAGSSLMDFKSFLNGRRASQDDKFLTIDSGL
jgi:methionyl-tRNA formyltransferase